MSEYCNEYSPQVTGTYKWPHTLASIAKTVLLWTESKDHH